MLDPELLNAEMMKVDCSNSLALVDEPIPNKFVLLDNETKDSDLILSSGFQTFFKYKKDDFECQIDECSLHLYEN